MRLTRPFLAIINFDENSDSPLDFLVSSKLLFFFSRFPFFGRKKMARKPTTVERRASFFKVLLGDFTEKLRLPPAFVKSLEGKLPLKLVLRNSARRCWHIKVERIASYLFFQNGWAEFVKENLLQIGNTLVFGYDGNMEINVKIFGRSGCEKEDTSLDTNYDGSVLLEEKKELHREREKVVGRNGNYECKCFSGRQIKRLVEAIKSYHRKTPSKQGPAVDPCRFNLEHPHFTRLFKASLRYRVGIDRWRGLFDHYLFSIDMERVGDTVEIYTAKMNLKRSTPHTHAYQSFLPIPLIFVETNNLRTKEHIYLHDHNEKRWKVSLLHGADGRVLVTRGWATFTKEHSLRDGDVCGFEFIRGMHQGTRRKIRVHIFRNGRRVVTD